MLETQRKLAEHFAFFFEHLLAHLRISLGKHELVLRFAFYAIVNERNQLLVAKLKCFFLWFVECYYLYLLNKILEFKNGQPAAVDLARSSLRR